MATADIQESDAGYSSKTIFRVKELFSRHHDYPEMPVPFSVGLVSMDTSGASNDLKTEETNIDISPQKFTLSGNVHSVEDIRYVIPSVLDNAMYIVISVYNNLEGTPKTLFYTIKTLDGYQAVSITNLIRKSVYDKFISVTLCGSDLAARAVNFNRPLFSDDVYCSVTSDEDYKTYYVRIDKECMCFFTDQFQRSPILTLLFWKEIDDFVVERVCMTNDTKEIKLECTGAKVLDQRNVDEIRSVIANNSSRPKLVFHDYQALLGHLSGSRDEPLSETRSGPYSVQTRPRTEHQQWGPSTFEGPSTSGFFQDKDEFEEIIDSLRTAETQCSQMGPEMSETTSLNWIVAESDIQQIQEAGLFPESVLQSAAYIQRNEIPYICDILRENDEVQLLTTSDNTALYKTPFDKSMLAKARTAARHTEAAIT
uniref:Uncharacterized protein n=1 Tax=Magallana gigas TaxID=29159 RepID=K1QX83_MAGGI